MGSPGPDVAETLRYQVSSENPIQVLRRANQCALNYIWPVTASLLLIILLFPLTFYRYGTNVWFDTNVSHCVFDEFAWEPRFIAITTASWCSYLNITHLVSFCVCSPPGLWLVSVLPILLFETLFTGQGHHVSCGFFPTYRVVLTCLNLSCNVSASWAVGTYARSSSSGCKLRLLSPELLSRSRVLKYWKSNYWRSVKTGFSTGNRYCSDGAKS